MIEYEVLVDGTSEDLVNQVREFLAQGWQPFGGVSVTFTGVADSGPNEGQNYFLYAQALTRPLRGGS